MRILVQKIRYKMCSGEPVKKWGWWEKGCGEWENQARRGVQAKSHRRWPHLIPQGSSGVSHLIAVLIWGAGVHNICTTQSRSKAVQVKALVVLHNYR